MTQVRRGAVVTGAGGGLGREIARVLVERGHYVLVTDVDESAAEATVEYIGADRSSSMVLDVRDADQVDAALAAVVERAGGLEVWVNNAGVLVTGPVWEQAAARRDLMLDVNARGTVNGTVAAIDWMRANGGGHIVNIASLAGITPVSGEAVYAASKHAVIGFSLSTASDLKAAGIANVQISCVCPGGIWSPMLYDKLTDPAAALSFAGSLLQPSQVVATVAAVLDRPRLVTTIPRWRGWQGRWAAAFPRAGRLALPLVVAGGRRRQAKLVRQGLGRGSGGGE